MIFLLLVVASGFMVSAFLARGVTGVLAVSYAGFGPVEIRVCFIVINAWLTTFGQPYMAAVIPYVVAGSGLVLATFVYRTQAALWRLDRARLGGDIERADSALERRELCRDGQTIASMLRGESTVP